MISNKLLIVIFLMSAAPFWISLYPYDSSITPEITQIKISELGTNLQKIENFSIDYSKAHIEVMKNQDEVLPSTF